jgi:hypothetical protein
VGLLFSAVATSVSSAHPPRPTSINTPLADGCQRSLLGIGFDTTPQWVYIYRDPAMRTARGVVVNSHPSREDSILQHRSYDSNFDLVPSPQFSYLIAGNPAQQTNNFAPGAEETGKLHVEWETATLPPFAWPTDGDRATIWGSWIWDCGHWTAGGEADNAGSVTGERSELHPLSAIAVQRLASYRSSRGESETDTFVSNEGDGAHAVEQCALSHHPVTPPGLSAHYDAGYMPCATNVANRLQPRAKSYTFFVPAPPKLSAAAQLRWRIANRIRGGSGTQTVTPKPNGIQVTVRLHDADHVVRYGKSFFVSWTAPPRHFPVALNVTLKSILINHADPNPAVPDPSGANWNLYLDVNGYWQLINVWAPRLTSHITDGERIAVNRTVKIHVPQRARVWFEVTGRECDEPAGKVVLGVFAHLLYPCPANLDEMNPNILLVFVNDSTGTVLDRYRSAQAALGSHISTADSGNYQVSYVIRAAARRRPARFTG